MKTKPFIYFFFLILITGSAVLACKKPVKEYLPPTVSTIQPVDITDTEATLKANFIKGTDNISVFGFLLKKESDNNWKEISAGATGKNFSAKISHLEEDTKYNVKSFMIDGKGNKYWGAEIKFFTHGTMADIDGNIYLTFRYGDIVWMTENLRVTRFADGTPIEERTKGENTQDDEPVFYSSYYHTRDKKGPNFGLLYNWAAATGAENCHSSVPLPPPPFGIQGICPEGWMLPTETDWHILAEHNGGMSKAGAAMKTSNWSNSYGYISNNYSQFSVEPAGFYNYNTTGNLNLVYNSAYFWTPNATSDITAKAIALVTDSSSLFVEKRFKWTGYSVRCLKNQ